MELPKAIKSKSWQQTIFWIFMALHLWPILSFKVFPTFDGPAHLYNASLIAQLLTDPASIAHQYFQFNTSFQPNWTSHILLAIFNELLPAYLAEKLLLIIYAISLPLAFVYLVCSIKKEASFFTAVLVLPFIYSFLFFLGFYNFCLAVSLLLFTLGYWLRLEEKFTFQSFLGLFILMIVLLLTHLFSLVMLLLIISVYGFWEIRKNSMLQKLLWTYLAALPGIIIALIFFLSNTGDHAMEWLPFKENLLILAELKPLIALNYDEEVIFTRIIEISIALLLIIQFFLSDRKQRNKAWWIVLLSILIIYFITPHKLASGGYMAFRLALIFGIFLCLMAAIFTEVNSISLVLIAVIGITSTCRVFHYTKAYQGLANSGKVVYESAEQIETGSTVLPLNYSSNWLAGNLLCYLGAEKDIAVLENYEADKVHFPLVWKENMQPNDVLGNHHRSRQPWIDIPRYEQKTGTVVDYVYLWQHHAEMNDSNTVAVINFLQKNYTLQMEEKGYKLYQKKE